MSSSGFNLLDSSLHILCALSASINMILRGHWITQTFTLSLMIARLSHATLYHMITEFHTYLLIPHTMTSVEKSTYPILLFLHLFYAFFFYFSLSLSIFLVFLWTCEEEGTFLRCIAPSPCYTLYVPEIMFHSFEDTNIWGLSNHIVSFLNVYGPPLIIALPVYTDMECPLL